MRKALIARISGGGRLSRGLNRAFSFESPKSNMQAVPIDTVIFTVKNVTMKNGILNGGRMKIKKAFTLAEVLITLGIIGIVAVMTLPTIVQQNQKKVAATRLKQTYSQLYQAINMAQADYGDMKNWNVNDNYYSSVDPDNPNQSTDMASKFAETYMKPYLKYNGIPGSYKLSDKGYSSYYTKDGRGYFSAKDIRYIMELSNGVTLFIGYNGNGDVYSLPIIFVDINGKTKPNVLGRDFFKFDLDSVSKMKIIPSGYGYKREKLLELCAKNGGGKIYDNLSCTGLIMHDGWEIKRDYPW